VHARWAGNEANEAVKQAGLKQMWDRKEYLAKKEIKKEDAAIRVKEEGIRRKITVRYLCVCRLYIMSVCV
tara:strand:+ start:66 stop:275 length:210 start_codon:yes stop_codon:yes gene_type:complete